MQNQNLILLEDVVSSKQMAKHLQVTEDVIEELCEKELLKAKYLKNGWVILSNQELPCLIQFKNVDSLNYDNYNILNGHYELEDIEGLAYWPIKLIEEDDNNIGFQNICVDRGVYKDASGKLHTRYVLEIETFFKVSTWDVPLTTVLFEVGYAISPKAELVAVFESEADAYKYANKLYPELLLEEYIILRYLTKY